jgi:hypothetical protein
MLSRLTFRMPGCESVSVKPKSRLAIKVDRRLARKVYRERFRHTDADLVPDFDSWLEGGAGYLAEIMVLHPGGRATLPRGLQVMGAGRDSHGRPQVARAPVELWWRRSSDDGLPYITAFRIEAPPGAVFTPYDHPYGWELDVGDWWAGLVLRLESEGPAVPEDAPPPASGKAPSLAHYKAVIAAYDELVREGHPAPISVLADRFQARPGTVKSWLHRGRRYLKGEQQ